MDGGAWQATVYAVAKSWTLLSDFTFFLSQIFTLEYFQRLRIISNLVSFNTLAILIEIALTFQTGGETVSRSVVSDSLRPHGLQLTRLLCPWNSPDKNTGVGCYFLLLRNGFLHSSVGKESTCNAEDPISIPWLGISPGEGMGYPLQYSWASLMAQLVKNFKQ